MCQCEMRVKVENIGEQNDNGKAIRRHAHTHNIWGEYPHFVATSQGGKTLFCLGF